MKLPTAGRRSGGRHFTELGLEATLTPGARGVFDVIVDGHKIFSKHVEHRFPDQAEIVAALKARRG